MRLPELLFAEIADDVVLILPQHAEGRTDVVVLQHRTVIVQHSHFRPVNIQVNTAVIQRDYFRPVNM